MTKKLNWLLPLTVFLLTSGLGIADRYWWWVRSYYTKTAGSSCALARGYAQDFQTTHGHNPTIEELRLWAAERFKADLDRMTLGYENPQWTDPITPLH